MIASALIATSLGACVTSNVPAPLTGTGIRVTLPSAPEGVEACLKRSFPEIPDRALTKGDVVRIIGEAKVLDRAKSACGQRAVDWIQDVRGTYAR